MGGLWCIYRVDRYIYWENIVMSLEKGIEYGKERRRDYQGSKKFDRSCRHGGSCDYCRNGRQYNSKKRELSIEEQIKEYKYSV